MDTTLLAQLEKTVTRRGGVVRWGNRPAGAGRHIGTLEGHDILLYHESTVFESWFTLAHLFGHMCQRTRPTANMYAAIGLVDYNRVPAPLTPREIYVMWEHELEAAQLGAALVEEAGGVTDALRAEYARMFMADYRYLVAFLETGVGGEEAFNAVWNREPVTEPITPVYNLADLNVTPPVLAPDVHVI